MNVSAAIVATAPVPATVETRGSWIVCLTALGIAAVSFAAPAILVVGFRQLECEKMNSRALISSTVFYSAKSTPGVRGQRGRPPSGR